MAEEMHPAKGAGRDSNTQKNLLRKVINTLESNHKDSTNHHKEKMDYAETFNSQLARLIRIGDGEQKDRQNEKGDKKEEEVERKGLFQKLANLPTALKDSVQGVKDAPSNLMSSLGKKVKGFGGMLGKLASGAGIGILAIVATAGLMSSGLIDGEKVKNNVLSLLSIGNEMDVAKLATLVAFPTAMKQIATGLVFFSAGGGIAGMTQGILDKFDQGNWAETTKKNVLTLLSIGESLDVAKLATLALFKPAMMALGFGLAAFGAGEAIAGIGQMVGFDAGKLKDQVGTLLSIGEHVGSIGDAAWLIAFAPVMTALGVGLAAFGIGTGIGGIAQLTNFDAQLVKDQVLTLLSIPKGIDGGALGMLADGGAVSLALAGLGAGLAVFGGGQVIKALGDFFSKENFAEKTKQQVLTLLSIGDSIDNVDVKAAKVRNAMVSLGAGLAVFSGSQLIAGLADAGTKLIAFISGGQSPITQMLSIADKETQINKAANGVDRLAQALQRMSGINIGAGNVDIEGMLRQFGHLPALLDGLANGSKHTFEGVGIAGTNKTIDFKKGILDPSLKVPEISAKMNQVNSALGIGPVRNPEINAQTNSNAELKTNAMTAGGGVVAVNNSPTSNTTNNTTAMYGDPTPATDDLDRNYGMSPAF
jgi:hypothetical protein